MITATTKKEATDKEISQWQLLMMVAIQKKEKQ